MYSLSGKSKQFLIPVAKVLIVAAAFYFIWLKLSQNTPQDRENFIRALKENLSWPIFFLLILLSFLNRFFEILKWKVLVSSFKIITLSESAKQVLAALTLSIFTPNGIGEYGAKALFFEKQKAKFIVLLNLVCNGVQMIISVIAGVIGLIYLNWHFSFVHRPIVIFIFGGVAAIFPALFLSKKFKIRGYSLERIINRIKDVPSRIHLKNAVLALGRYLIFTHQYYLIFIIFGVRIDYPMMIAAIFSMYFVASAMPAFQFFDFAVKGGVAVFFFSMLNVNEWIPVFAATLMWLLNVVLPVLIGSYYVLTFKLKWKQS